MKRLLEQLPGLALLQKPLQSDDVRLNELIQERQRIPALFALGVLGFLLRRNIITVFMSIELMLNAVNLSFVTFSYVLKRVDGHIFSFFVMVVAAAEAAVGLAIILTVFKNRQTLEIDEVSSLKN